MSSLSDKEKVLKRTQLKRGLRNIVHTKEFFFSALKRTAQDDVVSKRNLAGEFAFLFNLQTGSVENCYDHLNYLIK